MTDTSRSRLQKRMRLAAFVVPASASVILLVHAWRADFPASFLKLGGATIFFCALLAHFYWRRSKDQPAFFWDIGVSDSSSNDYKDEVDVTALTVGIALVVFLILLPLFL